VPFPFASGKRGHRLLPLCSPRYGIRAHAHPFSNSPPRSTRPQGSGRGSWVITIRGMGRWQYFPNTRVVSGPVRQRLGLHTEAPQLNGKPFGGQFRPAKWDAEPKPVGWMSRRLLPHSGLPADARALRSMRSRSTATHTAGPRASLGHRQCLGLVCRPGIPPECRRAKDGVRKRNRRRFLVHLRSRPEGTEILRGEGDA